ncbi:MAG: serine/threonine protein kinase [Lentisphaeria bacterium]|nr:serine/threonine protein kinase [Lentisphaeria bacterium]
MKIRCPQCLRISEIPHVDHGRIAVCACRATFRIDDSTVVEELSLPDLPPPESIGRYSIVRYVGRGASNCVYEGIHPDLGVPVAVKTLLPEYAADKPSRDQFLHAAKVYAKAVHPNIVKVYETGRDANGVPFLAMEFLSGGTLADSIQKNGSFPPGEAARIGAEVCRALVVTAGLGIVHRDIKPDNIMLSAEGQYKLTDLGLAKLDGSSASGNGALVLDEDAPDKSSRKTSFGTLEYMSPEQYIDTESCDIRSDIYSLGVTMYQLATGRLPFETQTRSELRHMHISVEPLVPSTYMHGIPIDFDYIVMRCIQKRPEDRYGSPEELLADLEAFLADAPLPSTTSGAVPYVRTPALTGSSAVEKRSMLLPAVAAVLVLLILAVGGLLLLKGCSAAPPANHLAEPREQAETEQETTGFDVSPSGESSVPAVRPSTKALDAEITIGGENIDSQASGLFEETKKAAARAMKDGFGFRKAIDDLESFTSSEEYATEAFNLISDLKKASDAAVAKLMTSLNEKAAPLIREGNYDAAINVYSTDIGPLAPESLPERERKMLDLELEKMHRAYPDMDMYGNAAPGSDENAAGEGTPP